MTQIQAIEENIFAYYKGIARLLGGQFIEQDQDDWLQIMMEGSEEPEAARHDIQQYLLNSLIEPQPVFEHFLALWQGEPCATSTLLHAVKGAGIYNVTTLPAYRRRGLGTALTLSTM